MADNNNKKLYAIIGGIIGVSATVTIFYFLWRPSRVRWGIRREPKWVDGLEKTAPSAGEALVTKTVSSGKTGRVFGVHITADEANQFQLCIEANVVKDFTLGLAGTIHIVLGTPLIDNVATGKAVTIKVISAGGMGRVYQSSLLYDEG